MTTELIGVIAATIALATFQLAWARGLRHELRSDNRQLREEIKAVDLALREETGALRHQMEAGDASLREEMKAGDNALREEMKAGFKDLGARVGAVEHRLAKVEGIIEGLFWSTRNQPPDSPREGVA